MVYEDARGLACHDGFFESCQTIWLVQVTDDNEVGCIDDGFHLLLLLGVDEDAVCSWQPLQEVWKDVGHDDYGLLAFPFEVVLQGKRGAYCIAIGIDMGADDDVIR